MMNQTTWNLPEINIYDAVFHVPSVYKPNPAVKTKCTHCGKNQIVYTVELIHWPDREEIHSGYVWICAHCGSRHVINRKKPRVPRFLHVLFFLLGALFLFGAIALSVFWLNRQHPNDSDHNSYTSVETSDSSNVNAPLVNSETLDGIGNSFINISEGGLMVIVDDWIYYTNPSDDYCIYRMDLNMESSELLCGIPAYYLNYHEGMLYFSGSSDSKQQYRMNLDGSGLELVNSRTIYEGKIVGDYLYYDDANEDYALYRSKLDGSEETHLSDGVAFYTLITDDEIYYIDTSDDRYCYRMDLDGRNKEIFINKPCRDMCLLDDVMYLTLQDGGVYAYDTEYGGPWENAWKISDVNAGCINAHDDGWIYFCNHDKGYKLYKMTLDGENMTKMLDDPIELLNVYSNLVSYRNQDTEQFYWCLTDSSHKTAIR